MDSVPGEERILLVKRVSQETGGAKIDGDSAGVKRIKVVCQKPVFQSRNRVAFGSLQSLRALGHRFVENCKHFLDRRSEPHREAKSDWKIAG